MPEDRKPQSANKYIVRFPDGMRDQIAEAAKANNRTMNAEIVARLEKSFDNDSSSRGLITVSMDEFDAVIESAVNRAVTQALKAGNR